MNPSFETFCVFFSHLLILFLILSSSIETSIILFGWFITWVVNFDTFLSLLKVSVKHLCFNQVWENGKIIFQHQYNLFLSLSTTFVEKNICEFQSLDVLHFITYECSPGKLVNLSFRKTFKVNIHGFPAMFSSKNIMSLFSEKIIILKKNDLYKYTYHKEKSYVNDSYMGYF